MALNPGLADGGAAAAFAELTLQGGQGAQGAATLLAGVPGAAALDTEPEAPAVTESSELQSFLDENLRKL